MMEIRQNPSLLIQGEMAHKEDIHSCDLDLFIVNDLGRVVVDNHVDSCALNEEQVSANGNLFDIFDWQLTNEEGCMIDSMESTPSLSKKTTGF